MKNRNENQSKHIANSLRVLGMAQFVTFGYPAFIKDNFYHAAFFVFIYGVAEFAAYLALKKE